MTRFGWRHGGLTSNAARSMGAHTLTLGASLLTVGVLPWVASVETFGYWNLYILLTSFVYLLSLGLNDGILLRLGGNRFDDLDWPLLSRFLLALCVLAGAMAIVFGLVGARLSTLSPVMVLGISAAIPILLLTSFLSYILLASNRIKQYALSIVVGRVVFILEFLLLLAWGPTLGALIVADMLANASSLIYVAWVCRPLLGGRRTAVRGSVFRRELSGTARAGLTLMIAGITASATMGAVRLVVDAEWGIAVFAGLSLALSAAHLLTSFLQAAATVVFPWLRRIDKTQIRLLHRKMHMLMLIMSLVALSCFFPLRWAMALAFPQYSESVEFLFIVFPVVVYQARIALLVTPFLNALHKVGTLLWVNVLGLIVSLACAVLFGFGLRHLLLTVMSMLLGQGIRMLVGEIIVRRSIGLSWRKPLLFDFLVVALFVVCATALPELLGALGFCAVAALLALSLVVAGQRSKVGPVNSDV